MQRPKAEMSLAMPLEGEGGWSRVRGGSGEGDTAAEDHPARPCGHGMAQNLEFTLSAGGHHLLKSNFVLGTEISTLLLIKVILGM